ncbi:MAG: hypothetical protein AB7L91_10040 [Dehalococcoidia bacterium]
MRSHPRTSGRPNGFRISAQLALWTGAWAATLALARFGPTHLWDLQPTASWAAVALNLVTGVGWIVAHARYLQELDELERKINLDALALTLGVGFVAGLAYVTVDKAELIDRDVNVALLPLLMAAVYVIAIAGGHLRYR